MNEKIAATLAEALEWYVKNDDTNEGDPENKFWVEGKRRAQKALELYRESQDFVAGVSGQVSVIESLKVKP